MIRAGRCHTPRPINPAKWLVACGTESLDAQNCAILTLGSRRPSLSKEARSCRCCANLRVTDPISVVYLPPTSRRGSARFCRGNCGIWSAGQPSHKGCSGNHSRGNHLLARSIFRPRRQTKRRSIGAAKRPDGRDTTRVYCQKLRHPISDSASAEIVGRASARKADQGGEVE